jgi:Fe-S cluster biogenesis protein NfuA
MSVEHPLKTRVAQVLEMQVKPALHMDGTDIEVLDVQDGVVRVRLHGTCTACPSTIMAVIMGIEEELRKRIPEVQYLEAVP